MRAMLLDEPGTPLRADEVAVPEPGPGQLLLRVHACGVCRTDLHLRDGEIEPGHLPLILGHQIVATTEDGRRVGVPWLGWTDGDCCLGSGNAQIAWPPDAPSWQRQADRSSY